MKFSNMDQFAAFILTHGRPNNVITYDTLRKHGYTGKIYLIVDDMDPTKDQYIEKYGDQVVVFSKHKARKFTDQGDNTTDLRSVVYARNESFNIAKRLGLWYFVQLDDDYNYFKFRFNEHYAYVPSCKTCVNLDNVFIALIKFLNWCPSYVVSVSMTQGGDFIGGKDGKYASHVTLLRKCMNSFVCCVERPFRFSCKMNDDVTTYTSLAPKGVVFFSTNQISLNQLQTQKNAGGMTEIYLDQGTYVKSFYSVMFQPSSVKINLLNTTFKRIHHLISWNNTAPKILRASHKKE